MTSETAVRVFCGLWGAAIGAAAQGVSWTWWAGWAVAWAALYLIAYWHRGEGHVTS